MTVEDIKAAHLAYWKHTESCWTTGDPANGITGCSEHDELYAIWQGKLNACPGIYVNEASIMATGTGVSWWVEFTRFRSTYRIESLARSEYFVMCDDEDAAQLLKMHMLEARIPLAAIKIKTFGQCQHLRRTP